MAALETVGKYILTNRELLVAEITNYHNLPNFHDLPSKYFTCFINWNDSAVESTGYSIVHELLESGCVCLDTWGPDCERNHDVIDSIIATKYPDQSVEETFLTTLHAKESLDESLWTFLNANWPASSYIDECRVSIGISIKGTLADRRRIRYALSHPNEFSSEVLHIDKSTDK